MLMKHTILVILLIWCLFSGVFALKQVEPYSQVLVGSDFVGKAVPGSTLQLIFSKENEKYDSLKITNTLPTGFSVAIKEEFESFKVIITVPDNAPKGQYKINLKFSKTGDILSEQDIEVYFSVDKELLFVSMDNFSQKTFTGTEAEYVFTLINNSDASANFKILSSLPNSWYSKQIVSVNSKSIVKQTVKIIPGISGQRNFVFEVNYSGQEKFFDVSIISEPTIESKFSSTLNGLPFYSFSLIPSYFLNGLISLFF